MKKVFVSLLLSAVVLFAVSCDKDTHPEALQHRWVLTDHVCTIENCAANGGMTLTFDNVVMQVADACEDIVPFPLGSSRWEYYVEHDTVLTISTYQDSNEDYTPTEGYEFTMHLSADGKTLTLDYTDEHLTGGEDKYSYTFTR